MRKRPGTRIETLRKARRAALPEPSPTLSSLVGEIERSEPPVALSAMSLPQLALFVGQAADELILTQLLSAGFSGLRQSHGYVVQHLLTAPRTVGQLAKLLEVSQQAASKSVADLSRSGYVEDCASEDARERLVQLSARGRACVEKARELRRSLDSQLSDEVGATRYRKALETLVQLLELLGGAEAVRRRRVRMSR